MKDEHISAISKQGGVIGVNFYYRQLTDERTAELDDVIRHIAHFIEIGGIDCVALGSDFDGMNRYIDGLEDSSGLPLIANKLSRMGLSDADIRKIAYGNLARYIMNFC